MSEITKVSFGFKKSTKVQNIGITGGEEDGPAKVALSAVERGGRFRTVDGLDADSVIVEKRVALVIPKQDNTYKAGKFKPSFVPPSADAPVGGKDGDDKFESAAAATAGPSEPQVYGLQHVQRKERTDEQEGGRAGLGGSITERLTAAKEEQAYQRDVEELPEMASVQVGSCFNSLLINCLDSICRPQDTIPVITFALRNMRPCLSRNLVWQC